ncbi:MAG TPA: heat-inducible transcriptional repressor HrcA [Gaiellaceae bacterium]|nr:heat-inducible transcriptional repressor HrcA [Gaiellaceae bacterium]
MISDRPQLTARQRDILRHAVEEYIQTGQPVGSRYLVEHAGLSVSASTVRSELAELERLGLLTHPHTSAGRVPTEEGYRLFVQGLLDRIEPRAASLELDLAEAGTEVESALQATTEALSHLTRLLALVSAPPLEAATVRHVEVLALQPQVVVAVVITSTGGVTKRVFALGNPVDAGLVAWASEYLNERTSGLPLGSFGLRQAFSEPGLSDQEAAFLELLRPAFTDAAGSEEQRLYVGGAANLLGEGRSEDLLVYRPLLEALEQRAGLLALLGEALGREGLFVRVGVELEQPQLRGASLVGASYGLVHRRLGTVSLLGPLRMDYETAIRSVRAAARELSRFVEEIYAEN